MYTKTPKFFHTQVFQVTFILQKQIVRLSTTIRRDSFLTKVNILFSSLSHFKIHGHCCPTEQERMNRFSALSTSYDGKVDTDEWWLGKNIVFQCVSKALL